MEKKHRSVILFSEWQRPLGALSLEQKGAILDALLAYPQGARPDFADPMLRMAWTFMEGGLAENDRKWAETRLRRAEAGRRGAEVTNKKLGRQKSAKSAVSVSDSDTDSGSGSESVSDSESALPDGEDERTDAPLPPPGETDGFSPPDEEDVRGYFAQKGGTAEQADRFRAFYESNGWRVGQNPMRSWQASATVWMARDRERPAARPAAAPPKGKAFCATRPLEESRDFLKGAGKRRVELGKPSQSR